MKYLIVVCLLAFSLHAQQVPPPPACAPQWSYGGYTGPQQWHRWGPLCGDGERQSPVDLRWRGNGSGDRVQVRYEDTLAKVENNGYEIRVSPTTPLSAGFIVIGTSQRAFLVQFHIHTPSEHLIMGQRYPAELHLVHEIAGSTDLAVIGVPITIGDGNAGLNGLFEPLTAALCQPPDTRTISFSRILENVTLKNYLTYPGSLTTPGCAQNVTWYIPLFVDMTLTQAQFDRLRALGENARPLQPLKGRIIRYVTAQ